MKLSRVVGYGLLALTLVCGQAVAKDTKKRDAPKTKSEKNLPEDLASASVLLATMKESLNNLKVVAGQMDLSDIEMSRGELVKMKNNKKFKGNINGKIQNVDTKVQKLNNLASHEKFNAGKIETAKKDLETAINNLEGALQGKKVVEPEPMEEMADY